MRPEGPQEEPGRPERRVLPRSQRILVFGIGLLIGTAVLSMLWRQGGAKPGTALKRELRAELEAAGLRALPAGAPAYLRESRLETFWQTAPDAAGRAEYIWILEVREGHPWVRVTEELKAEDPGAGGRFTVMAADAVLVRCGREEDLPGLDARLAGMGLRRGEYFRGEPAWRVDLPSREALAVPRFLARINRGAEGRWEAGPWMLGLR